VHDISAKLILLALKYHYNLSRSIPNPTRLKDRSPLSWQWKQDKLNILPKHGARHKTELELRSTEHGI